MGWAEIVCLVGLCLSVLLEYLFPFGGTMIIRTCLCMLLGALVGIVLFRKFGRKSRIIPVALSGDSKFRNKELIDLIAKDEKKEES